MNANDVAWTGGLRASLTGATADRGALAYQANCTSCHGPDRKGAPPDFPSLVSIGSRLMGPVIDYVIRTGRGRMPAFIQLDATDREALVAYLRGGTSSASSGGVKSIPIAAPAYVFSGYRKFLDPDGYPAVTPPWGTLSAIDLNTGRYLWKRPLGEYPALVAKGISHTGSENYGGPIVTAGGLVIIGATIFDRKPRIFDSHTGRLLWESVLPYAGVATPATYMVEGRQYIVIAASGSRDESGPQGSAYVAFALPPRARRGGVAKAIRF